MKKSAAIILLGLICAIGQCQLIKSTSSPLTSSFSPIIIPPIIIDPPIIIIPINTYDKKPLAADAIAFADFNNNDSIDYVRTDSLDNEVVMEIRYDSVSIQDNIYTSDTSSVNILPSPSSTTSFALADPVLFSPTTTISNTYFTPQNTILEPVYLNQYYTINQLNLIDGSYIFRDDINSDDENRIYIPNGAISIGDFNNDNLPDFLTSGTVDIYNDVTDEYERYNKAMVWYNLDTAFMIMWTLTEPIENNEVWDFNNVEDFNHDGLQDIDIGGYIYYNDGLSFNNALKKASETPHVYPYQGNKVYMDYDQDGALDYHYNDTLYINASTFVNTKPNPPDNLTYFINSDTITLCWSPGSDSQSSTSNLTYNVWVGTTGNGTEVVSPLANLNTGKRKLYKIGNAGRDTCYNIVLKDAITATLYWSVQTIDGSYEGSEFPEKVQIDYSIFTPLLTEHSDGLGNTGKVFNGISQLFDADNDNDLDLLTSGNHFYLNSGGVVNNGGFLQLYENSNFPNLLDDGNNLAYDEALGYFQGYTGAIADVFDFNLDGKLDFIISGSRESLKNTPANTDNKRTAIFENTGSLQFTEHIFQSINLGDVASGDFDNDGDEDILISGLANTTPITRVYENNKGIFSSYIDFEPLTHGNVGFIDFDNDRDLDIVISGENAGTKSLRIYENLGNKNFELVKSIEGVSYGDIVIADLNNDNFLDIVITGNNIDGYPETLILRNIEGKRFSTITPDISGVGRSDIAIEYSGDSYSITGKSSMSSGDFDNDGLIDILITGKEDKRSTFLYKNMGDFHFETVDFFFDRVECSSANMGDLDNDGDLDFIVQGYNGTLSNCCLNRELYVNNKNYYTYAIDAPQNLEWEYDGLDIILSWSDAIYSEYYNTSLSYNLMVGTHPDSMNIVTPLSDPITGYRRVSKKGNVQMNRSWRLANLQPGTYYWSVQAINHAFKGGAWAPLESFEATTLNPFFTSTPICFGDTAQFTDSSISSSPLENWKWEFGDGNTISGVQNPKHIYEEYGKYDVTLWVYNQTDSMSITNTITVYPTPNASFRVEPVCKGDLSTMINLSDTFNVNVESWVWTFRNNHKSYVRGNVLEEYTQSDLATLEIISDKGCRDFDAQWVEVAEVPTANMTSTGVNDSICRGDSVILSVDYNSSFKYRWLLNDMPIYSPSDSSYTVKEGSGKFSVYVLNNIAGCIDSASMNITVLETPNATHIAAIGMKEMLCSNDTVLLKTNSSSFNYIWIKDGYVFSNDESEKVVETGSYALVLENKYECLSDTSNKIDLTFYPSPDISGLNISGGTYFCSGSTLDLSTTQIPEYTYNWLKTDGTIIAQNSNSVSINQEGNYVLEAENSYGCKTRSYPLYIEEVIKPPLFLKSETITICPESEVQLVPEIYNENYNFQWYNGLTEKAGATAPILEGLLEEGDYTLKCSNDQCDSISQTITIKYATDMEVPELTLFGPNVWYMGVNNAQASGYKWYLNDKVIEDENRHMLLIDQEFGTYKVAVSDNSGCWRTSKEMEVPNVRYKSAGAMYIPTRISTYPNPTNGPFSIELYGAYSGEVITELVDMKGDLIHIETFIKENIKHIQELNPALPQGVYFLSIKYNGNVETRSLIIE